MISHALTQQGSPWFVLGGKLITTMSPGLFSSYVRRNIIMIDQLLIRFTSNNKLISVSSSFWNSLSETLEEGKNSKWTAGLIELVSK